MPLWMTQQLIPSSEFTLWCAKEQLDPGWPLRGDYHAAQITSTIMNILRSGKLIQLSDVLLNFQPPRPSTPDQMARTMDLWASQMDEE